jgi:dipeptidyl aminopeptidase/acylaminoacyl peptidase
MLSVWLSLALAVAAPPPAAGGFTIEQVLSAPYPTDLTAAPAGGGIAWIFDARGARNVWAALPPEYKGRAVTPYAADDGQEMSDLAFTSDGRSIVYVRGGGPNKAGEIPNPASDPAGATEAVYVVSAAGGEPKKLGDGSSPAVSPRGDRVAFTQKGKVFVARLDGSEKSSPAFEARGRSSHLAWSPDGRSLAFVSGRGGYSFVGVFDSEKKTIRWLSPGVDLDGEPAWSPDGKRIAFLRIPGSPAAREILRPHREGPPWSILVADPSTGEARTVFHADAGKGSVFRRIVAKDQLAWAAGDRLVFPWEKDAWTHLYSVSASGETPTLLTPGAFEVEHVSVSPDRAKVYYASNQDDIERRHIWSVTLNGVSSRPVAFTSGDGLEWSPVVLSDGAGVAFVKAGAKKHPAPVLRSGDRAGERELAPGTVPAEFPEASLVVPETLIFPSTDGMPIHAQLFRPAGLKAGERRPAVIFFHGGSQRQMLPGWHYMYYYRNAYGFNQYLASRGFVVLSVNYRSGIGYGMEFREAVDFGAKGASEYRDVAGAGLYMRSRPDVDGARIGLWGGSYGGYLTALGLARASDLFAAGVDLHGVHDWSDWFHDVMGEDDRFRLDERRLAFESSPMADVKNWRSPVLLIHGDDDRNVPFQQTVMLAEALRERGVPFEELIFPDEIHDFLMHAHWLAAYRAASDFFDRKLAARPAGGK